MSKNLEKLDTILSNMKIKLTDLDRSLDKNNHTHSVCNHNYSLPFAKGLQSPLSAVNKQCLAFLVQNKLATDPAPILSAIERLTETLSKELPKLRMQVYGSFAYRLFLAGQSDVDLAVSFVDEPLDRTKANAKSVLRVLKNLVAAAGCVGLNTYLNARVPVLKCVDPKSALKFDLTVADPLSVQKTRLMRLAQSFDPRVGELLLVVRRWTHAKRLVVSERSGMNSYGWSICVLAFLMALDRPLLPRSLLSCSIFEKGETEEPHTKHAFRADFDVFLEFSYPRGLQTVCYREYLDEFPDFLCSNTATIAELVYGFFQTFREFCFPLQAVSLREGGIAERGRRVFMERHLREFVLVDPFNDADNVGRNVNSFHIDQMVQEFNNTLNDLTEGIFKELE